MDEYARIRRAHRDGMSVREIARRFGHSKRTVRKALANAEPGEYGPRRKAHAPKLGAFTAIIDQILAEDEKAPPKQRHLATRLFDRLVQEHGYEGGYDQVRRYVQTHRRSKRELFVPLAHEPGRRVECDFGHIHVDFPDGRKLTPVLLVTWAYSNHCFAIALPSERTESILAGMVAAFEFFGCTPTEVWWDNPTTVATEILEGRQRTLHERYRVLASHYTFEPLFCMPARGNEKPHVENRVKRLQRHWATPTPSFSGLGPLNEYLRRRCEEDQRRTVQRKVGSIGERFAAEKSLASPLPARPFDPCIFRDAAVDKYQTIRFETNLYSAPRCCAFKTATIKAYPEEVAVVFEGQVVARHPRSYGRHEQVLDPEHYLTTLSRKPALLDHAPVYREWKLPAAFAELRSELEERHGAHAGGRRFSRVLQLLSEHPAERIARAIERCRLHQRAEPEPIAEATRRLRDDPRRPEAPADLSDCSAEVQRTTAVATGLFHFDRLLSQGDQTNVRG